VHFGTIGKRDEKGMRHMLSLKNPGIRSNPFGIPKIKSLNLSPQSIFGSGTTAAVIWKRS
jgi:hypothetical protein